MASEDEDEEANEGANGANATTGGPIVLKRRPGQGDAVIQAFLAQAPQ